MPRFPHWFQQVNKALTVLRDSSTPVIDRAGLEKLLQVSRRDAIRLLHRFGGYQAGRTFLIRREDLIQALAAVQNGDDFRCEVGRRKRLADDLDRVKDDLRARQVKLHVGYEQRAGASLPPGIKVTRPGVVEVQYGSAEDLLGRLYQLVQVASRDLELFRSLVGDSDPASAVEPTILPAAPEPSR